MRKKVGIIKRVSYIGLIFLLSINSFATIVSDNDGSAFITKAEFDALKSSFQSQIDTYNQSIDSKIDGAIASYLAGIKLTVEKDENIINNDWDSVIFKNGVYTPGFVIPSIDLTTGFVQWSAYSYRAANETNCDLAPIIGKYTYDNTAGSVRPLFGVISGSESSPTSMKIYYRGCSQKWREKWTIGFTQVSQYSDLNNLGQGSEGVYMYNVFKLMGTGYFSNLNSSSIYSPSTKYFYNSGSNTNSPNSVSSNTILQTQVFLENGSDGKQTKWDHVVEYDGSKVWALSNEQFLHTLRQYSGSNTDTQLYNACTKTTQGRYLTVLAKSGWSYSQVMNDIYIGSFSSSNGKFSNSGSQLTSIGMLADRASQDIYQYSYDPSVKRAVNYCNKVFECDNITLEKGFQLCAAMKDVRCTWKVENLTLTGSGSPTEAEIYFSYEPFNDLTTTAQPLLLTNGTNHITTSGKKATAEWVMTKDSLVYVKIVPKWTSTSYISDAWEITLPLTGNAKVVTMVMPAE